MLLMTQEASGLIWNSERIRIQMFRQFTAVMSLLSVLMLVLGALTKLHTIFYPFDFLWILGISLLARLAIGRTASVKQVIYFYIACLLQPLFYSSVYYGVTSLVNVIFIPLILFIALLTGRGFLIYGGILYGLVTAISGLLQVYFPLRDVPARPDDVISAIVIWWALYMTVTTISWLFVHNIDHLLDLLARHTQMMTKITRTARQNQDLNHFLTDITKIVSDTTKSVWSQLLLYDNASHTLETHALVIDGNPVNQNKRNFAYSADIPLWTEIQETKQSVIIQSIANDERILQRSSLLERGVNYVLCVPLQRDTQVIGLLMTAYHDIPRYDMLNIELIEGLSWQISIALQVIALMETSNRYAQLAERTRIARDIHDVLAQSFTGIILHLDAIEAHLQQHNVAAAEQHLQHVRQFARESLDEARRSVHALRPQATEAETPPLLSHVLSNFMQIITKGCSVKTTVTVQGDELPLPDSMMDHLLRISQEGFSNAVKHGQASEVQFTLWYEPHQLVFNIQDNGTGFDAREGNEGQGLLGIRERTHMLGGEAHFNVPDKHGTVVSITLPLTPSRR